MERVYCWTRPLVRKASGRHPPPLIKTPTCALDKERIRKNVTASSGHSSLPERRKTVLRKNSDLLFEGVPERVFLKRSSHPTRTKPGESGGAQTRYKNRPYVSGPPCSPDHPFLELGYGTGRPYEREEGRLLEDLGLPVGSPVTGRLRKGWRI